MESSVVFESAIPSSPRRRSLRSAFLLPLLAAFAALASGPGATAQNLLANPDFDAPDGLNDWALNSGTWVLGADSGSCATSDAVHGTSAISGGTQYFFINSQQCIPVDPVATPVLYLAGMYKTTGNVFARLYLQYFSDSGCSSPSGFSGMVVGDASATWNRIGDAITLDPNAGSVQLFADNNVAVGGEPQFTAQWDRFYLGVEPQIFLDDFEFEGGSACHWSAVVGGS